MKCDFWQACIEERYYRDLLGLGRVNFHLIWPICGLFQQDSALYFRVLPSSLNFISHFSITKCYKLNPFRPLSCLLFASYYAQIFCPVLLL